MPSASLAESESQLLSPELLARIRSLQLRAQHLVNDLFAGEYVSAFKGRGMEFEQVRDYQPGDDVRHIDWKVTARMGSPFVKEHREERELTVMLVVDVSSSGRFGTTERTKQEVSAEVAAILAYTAIRSHDRVGLILFSDHIEVFIPPKKGRAHVWRVIRSILTHEPRRTGTDIEAALQYLGKVARRRTVCFLVSDFIDQGFKDALRTAGRRHDLTAVSIRDRREFELPDVGLIEVRDAESGEVLLLDTSRKRDREEFARRTKLESENLHEELRRSGVGRLDLWTHRSAVDDIVHFFRQRERRSGRSR